MIGIFYIHDVFAIRSHDICPQPIAQNTDVPWANKLQPHQTTLVLHSLDISRLLNCSFVKSPKLKVCILHDYELIERKKRDTIPF